MTAPTFQLTVHADDIELIEQLWKQLRRPDEHVPGSIDIDAGVVRLEVDLRGEAADTEPSWPARSCRECGCTTDRACPGGCSWVGPDLCSACEDPESLVLSFPLDARSDFERGTVEDLHAAGFDPQPPSVPARVYLGVDTLRLDVPSPAIVLDDLHRALMPGAESLPLLDLEAAWEATWRDFEGYSTRRLVIDALERLTGRPVLERNAVDPHVDAALVRAVDAMDGVLEHWTPPQTESAPPASEVGGDECGDLEPGDEDLPLAEGPHHGPNTSDGDTVDVGPVTVAESGAAAEIVDGSGDAEGREASEGTSSSPATSPGSSTTIDPNLPLTEQVAAVLEAAPDVTFTSPDVDLVIGRNDPKVISATLGTLAKRGRIRRLSRGLYQALGRGDTDDTQLRERIIEHLADGVASSTKIANALDEQPVQVVNELRRMADARLVRVTTGGWTLRDSKDDQDLIAARRAAAAEAM